MQAPRSHPSGRGPDVTYYIRAQGLRADGKHSTSQTARNLLSSPSSHLRPDLWAPVSTVPGTTCEGEASGGTGSTSGLSSGSRRERCCVPWSANFGGQGLEPRTSAASQPWPQPTCSTLWAASSGRPDAGFCSAYGPFSARHHSGGRPDEGPWPPSGLTASTAGTSSPHCWPHWPSAISQAQRGLRASHFWSLNVTSSERLSLPLCVTEPREPGSLLLWPPS